MYADGRAMGTSTSEGETSEIDVALEGAFGGGMTRRIVRSLPFEEGLTASFRQMGPDGDVSVSRVTVTGQEEFTRPAGTTTQVWVSTGVEEDQPDYPYYVDTETRGLLRSTFAPQPGVLVEITVQ